MTVRDRVTLERSPLRTLLPLENGDRLTLREFERRYQAMPHIKKAELVEGVVYMPSPVSVRHGRSHGFAMAWLGTYSAATSGVDLGDNATVRLDLENEVQPDGLLRLEPTTGGHSRISEDNYVEGPPELIVEIASSSVSYDLHEKLRIYRRNGVLEYIVWQLADAKLDWLEWKDGEYQPLLPDQANVIKSLIFPGLWLSVSSLLSNDLAAVLTTLQAGLQSAEHAAFCTQLASRKQ